MGKVVSTAADTLAKTAGRGVADAVLTHHLRQHRSAQKRLHEIVLFGEARTAPSADDHPLIQVVIETARRYSDADAAARNIEREAQEAMLADDADRYTSAMNAANLRNTDARSLLMSVQTAVRDFMGADAKQFSELVSLMKHQLKQSPTPKDAEGELLDAVAKMSRLDAPREPDADPTAMGDEEEQE